MDASNLEFPAGALIRTSAPTGLRPKAQQRCLVCKREVWIFEQMIHQDDQLSHDRRERDFGGFARRDQPVVKRFEQVIAPAGRQRGHVERTSHFDPPAADAALARPLPAVAVIRAESGQRGGLPPVERAQFGQGGQHHHGGEATHAHDVIKPLHLAGQRRLGLQEGFDEGFDFGDLLFHPGQPWGEEFAQIQIGTGVGALGWRPAVRATARGA